MGSGDWASVGTALGKTVVAGVGGDVFDKACNVAFDAVGLNNDRFYDGFVLGLMDGRAMIRDGKSDGRPILLPMSVGDNDDDAVSSEGICDWLNKLVMSVVGGIKI